MLCCMPDCHTHSHHSFDGSESLSDMLQQARQLGLSHLAVTDHCECQLYDTDGSREGIRSLYREYTALQNSAEGIRFLCGIELGQPTQAPAAAQDAVSAAPWDVVIGSLHNLRGREDFYFLDYTKEDVPALLNTYFQELLELAETADFDTLAHLTYPLRYICGEYGIPVDPETYRPQVTKIFACLIRDGRALELNTSGWRQKIGVSLPDRPWLELYRSLGGEKVTLGSDAHTVRDLGAGILRGAELLRELGFPGVTVYDRRRPVLIPFETDTRKEF